MNKALNERLEEDKSVHTRVTGLNTCDISTNPSNSTNLTTIPSTSTVVNKNDDEDDESVNVLNELDYGRDENTILLLKQIFPDESAENLWQFHLNRCIISSKEEANVNAELTVETTSPVLSYDTKRNQDRESMRNEIGDERNCLQLSQEVAVRRFVKGKWQEILVHDLTEQVISGHERHHGKLTTQSYIYYTKVVPRDASGGLGITLISNENERSNVLLPIVRVDSLTSSGNCAGPALNADVRCNDVLIGVDGVAFAGSVLCNVTLLQHAVSMVRSASDPVVLHFIRDSNGNRSEHFTTSRATGSQKPTPSLLDTIFLSNDEESNATSIPGDMSLHSDLSCSQAPSILVDNVHPSLSSSTGTIRPFIKVLANMNLLSSYEEQQFASKKLDDFDIRVNQWDELSAFFDPSNDSLIPLVNVRKGLSVRIVNTFDDDVDTAYTIWVYDVESGKEWYTPVRYFRDFEDLRAAVLPLRTASIQRMFFPRPKGSSLNLFLRSPKRVIETNRQRETKCRQLEHFLRQLCAMIYTEELHPTIAEVAIHVQSFLGCDAHEDSIIPLSIPFPKYVDLNVSKADRVADLNDDAQVRLQIDARLRLKRSIQCFTYRLFLLDGLCLVVDRFVDRLRISGPRLKDIEDLEAQGREVLKARALADLRQIQSFLDKIQGMILEGCMDDDFKRIAHKVEYSPILPFIRRTDNGSTFWDSLVREAVREQVEVEIYVPLRSVVSRWLVNSWRHEDMEVYFRMNVLRRRPPDFFRVESDEQHLDWKSVTTILTEGVGLSTLPCMKLRAIVGAAREIFRIIHPNDSSGDDDNSEHADGNDSRRVLGADDFLPIFIYCVVQAEMERPYALCVLLRTLCDPINQIGEIGYYLLTFEAALKHCEEVDLTDHDGGNVLVPVDRIT